MDSGQSNKRACKGAKMTISQKLAVVFSVLLFPCLLVLMVLTYNPAAVISLDPSEIRQLLGRAVSTSKSTTTIENGAVNDFYKFYRVSPPTDAQFQICHAYTCRARTYVPITAQFVTELGNVFGTVKTAQQERDAISRAVVLFENMVGSKIGTSQDRRGWDVFGSDDRTQMDSVDEAINTTSLILFLHDQNMVHYHNVQGPGWKTEAFITYYTAIIVDTSTDTLYSIDASQNWNGRPPIMQSFDGWKQS